MRPEGWETAFLEYWKPPPPDGDYKGFIANHKASFEAGADAMLEGLKKDGPLFTPEQMRLLAPDREYPYGYLVFIPEET